MALTESIEYDKIEVVGPYKTVQVRKATIIKKDGVELSRSFHRHILLPYSYDADANVIDTDISTEPTEVQAICNAVWTTDIKTAHKAIMEEQKPSG